MRLALALGLGLAPVARAAEGSSGRELSTDRPDQTESPYTVEAGRFQLELDAAVYTRDRERAAGGDVATATWALAPFNLKIGLHPRADLQVLFEPVVRRRVEDRLAGTVRTDTGPGDLTTRLKVNLWGNDGGPTAFALMPFVKWPLAASALRNGDTEGGLILPFAAALPGGWGLGAMAELDFVSAGAGRHEREYLGSATLGRGLTDRLAGYVEFVAVAGSAPGFRWQGQADVGLTYALGSDRRLDAGCNVGVTDAAPDLQLFLGFSQRF